MKISFHQMAWLIAFMGFVCGFIAPCIMFALVLDKSALLWMIPAFFMVIYATHRIIGEFFKELKEFLKTITD